MNIEKINKLKSHINLNEKQIIKILYLLEAWKKLSLDNKVIPINLSFNTVNKLEYANENLLNTFKYILDELSSIKVFKLFKIESDFLNTLSEKEFREIIEFLSFEDKLINVNKAFSFYDIKESSIPNQLVEFATKLLTTQCDRIYAPFNKRYNVAYFTTANIYAESLNREELFIVELMNILDEKNIKFKNADILLNPTYIEDQKLEEFECVVSFPPFSQIRDNDFFYHDRYNRFKIQKGKLLDVPHFEHILAQTRKEAVVLVHVGFTYRSGAEELFRQYIINNNWLEAIIQLPPNLHSATSIETTFFIINKEKKDNKVYFLNLKESSFLTKDGRKIILNDIDRIIDIYKTKKLNESYSALIRKDEIIENNYSLAIDRYIISKEVAQMNKQLSNYELTTLEYLATIKKSQLFKDESIGKEVSVLSPSDFPKAGYTYKGRKKIYIKEQYKKYETYKLMPYDILLSTKGTIGNVAILGEIVEPLLASQAIEIIRLKNKNKNKAIELYMFFKSYIGQLLLMQLVSGTAMPQISTKELRRLMIPSLSAKEREKILNSFDKEQDMFDEIQIIQKRIKKLHDNFLKGKI